MDALEKIDMELRCKHIHVNRLKQRPFKMPRPCNVRNASEEIMWVVAGSVP